MNEVYLAQQIQLVNKRLDRIDKKLNTLLSDSRKEQWVRVSFIQSVTGCNREKLRQAREQGLVKCEKRADGY